MHAQLAILIHTVHYFHTNCIIVGHCHSQAINAVQYRVLTRDRS